MRRNAKRATKIAKKIGKVLKRKGRDENERLSALLIAYFVQAKAMGLDPSHASGICTNFGLLLAPHPFGSDVGEAIAWVVPEDLGN